MPSSVTSFGLPHWLPVPPEIFIPRSWESARLSCTSYITLEQHTSVPESSFLKTKSNTKVLFTYTLSHKLCATLFLTITPAHLEQFLLFLVTGETGKNILQFTYLMAWWRHNYITLHVTKLRLQRCYRQLAKTVVNGILDRVTVKNKVADILWLTVYSCTIHEVTYNKLTKFMAQNETKIKRFMIRFRGTKASTKTMKINGKDQEHSTAPAELPWCVPPI